MKVTFVAPKIFFVFLIFLISDVRADILQNLASAVITWNDGDQVNSLAFNPDNTNRFLAVGGRRLDAAIIPNAHLEIYAFNGTSLAITTSKFLRNQVFSVDWNPSGNRLAIGRQNASGKGVVEIYSWDGASLSILNSISNLGDWVSSVKWSPDGNFVAVGLKNDAYNVRVFAWQNNVLVPKAAMAFGGIGKEVKSVAWSLEQNYLAVVGDNGTENIIIYQWLSEALAQKASAYFGTVANDVSWNVGGIQLVVSGNQNVDDNSAFLYEFNSAASTLTQKSALNLGIFSKAVSWAQYTPYIAFAGNTINLGVYQFDLNNGALNDLGAGAKSSSFGPYGTAMSWSYDLKYLAFGYMQGSTVGEFRIYFTPDVSSARSIPASAISGDLSQSIATVNKIEINQNTYIRVTEDLTIDGKGGQLSFAPGGVMPQLEVTSGKTLTLRNIELVGIVNGTIKCAPDARINIGENVIFDIAAPTVIDSGYFNLLNKDDGTPNTLLVIGKGGIQSLEFIPSEEYKTEAEKINSGKLKRGVSVLLNLNQNTIKLQSIKLIGVQYIDYSTSGYESVLRLIDAYRTPFDLTGAVELAQDSIVTVGSYESVVLSRNNKKRYIENNNCDMTFVVSGQNNKVMLLNDDMQFTGRILYADSGKNELSIDTDISEVIDDDGRTSPRVNFSTNCISLSSEGGIASLKFDDPEIIVNNEENAFIVNKNAQLTANKLGIEGDPIWDFYDETESGNQLVIKVKELVASDLKLDGAPIITSQGEIRSRMTKNFTVFKTALNFRNINKERKIVGDSESSVNITKSTRRGVSRGLGYTNSTTDLANAQGTIYLTNAVANNFSVHQTEELNLVLNNGSRLNLKTGENVTLKDIDSLNVSGVGNKINVSGIFEIDGNLVLEDGATLVFVLTSKDSRVVLKENFALTLGLSCSITFESDFIESTVLLYRTINFNGNSSDNSQNPSLILDRVTLKPMLSPVEINGIGNFHLINGALLDEGRTGYLRLGGAENDAITFQVFGNSILSIENGFMAFAKGNHQIQAFQSGTILIGEGGILGINKISQTELATQVNFNGFSFDRLGELYLMPGGKISISDNQNSKMSWVAGSATFSGEDSSGETGVVEYISEQSQKSFAGQIVLSNGKFKNESITAEELVRSLVNRSDLLSRGCEFLDAAGVRWIRLNDGTTAVKGMMTDGDVITKEYNNNGTVECLSSNGETVQYQINSSGTAVNRIIISGGYGRGLTVPRG